MLPFLVPRLYRSLMMEVWNLNNIQIGFAFSAYGLSAMISYVLGGPFADKYSPRGLIVISLFATILASLLLITIPSASVLVLSYGLFGVSTIFLMWSAMIKVTHEIGGENKRSVAMGILEGGRGFVAAAMSTFLVYQVGRQSNSLGKIIDQEKTLNSIYLSISIFMFFVAIIVWFSLKDVESSEAKSHDWSFEKAKSVAKNKNLWLLAVIILSAYCSYKNIGNYPVYMADVKKMSILESSRFTSYIFWARPISALVVGVFADKLTILVRGGRFITLFICFILGALSQLLIAMDVFSDFNLLISVILFSSSFAYALRAIYFSVFGEFKIKDSIVGTAVGIVSLVGYLPDFFYGTLTGYLIDSYPAPLGFSYVFIFNAILLTLGALASFICFKGTRE